jgi:hypothetical protein
MTGAHYALWLCLLTPLAWYALRALRHPVELFAPPLLVAFAFSGLYVFNYLAKPTWVIELFLRPDAYRLLLALTALDLVAFLLGHELARRSAPPERGALIIPEGLLPFWSLILVVVGFAALAAFVAASGGFWAYYGAPHGSGGAWEESTAYLYSLPSFLFPATYLLLARRLTARRTSVLADTLLVAALGYVVFQAVVFGNRGDTIRVCLVLGVSYLTLRPRRPGRVAGVGLLAIVSLAAVLVLPYLRSALHLGAEADIQEALAGIVDADATHPDVSGDELFLAAGLTQAVRKLGLFEWGLRWLFVLVNFVPRLWWPEKHVYFASRLVDAFEVAGNEAGYMVSPGAAWGGVAEGFLEIGWLSPLLWLILGVTGGRLWTRARSGRDVLQVGYCIGFLIGMVYSVTQGLGAGFYNWFFFAMPIWGLGLLARSLRPASMNGAPHTNGRFASPPGKPGVRP